MMIWFLSFARLVYENVIDRYAQNHAVCTPCVRQFTFCPLTPRAGIWRNTVYDVALERSSFNVVSNANLASLAFRSTAG